MAVIRPSYNDLTTMIKTEHIVTEAKEFTPNNEMWSVLDCIENGFIFMDGKSVVTRIHNTYFSAAAYSVGAHKRLSNLTFHKSFGTVEESTMIDLVIEQLIHYLSTYGLESMGYEARPVIPAEALDVPMNLPKFITVIYMVSPAEAHTVMLNHFQRIKQPTADTKWEFEQMKEFFKNDTLDVETFKSFELQMVVYQWLNTVPQTPTSFLRYLIYNATGQTMIVNSQRMVNNIKSHIKYSHFDYKKAFEKADLRGLASIFLRNKNLFLAFKQVEGCAPYINKIRRLAVKYHAPLSDVCVQNFYQICLHDRWTDAEAIIANCDLFDLVKLMNIVLIKGTREQGDPRMFNVRTGASFVIPEGSDEPTEQERKLCGKIMRVLMDAVAKKVDFTGKKFYMPGNISYGMPTSDKQYFGAIPWGTKVDLPEDKAFTLGIAWNNVDNQRVDLDLHMHNGTESYGWNGGYFNDKNSILFTGDMTDATNGAAEAFYFKPEKDEKYMLDISKYSGPARVPFYFFVNAKEPDTRKANYIRDAAEDLVPALALAFNGEDCATMNLGVLYNNQFVFHGGSVSANIGGYSKYYGDAVQASVNKMLIHVSLRDIIELCGGEFVDKADLGEDGIDLSPECLTEGSIAALFEQ